MSARGRSLTPEHEALLRWTARVGAVSADALAHLDGTSPASARARLGSLARRRLLAPQRLLVGEPTLYTITAAGLRRAGLPWVAPARVSAAGARHTLTCARAAAVLQRQYPDHVVLGERELRRRERAAARALASATLPASAASGALAAARWSFGGWSSGGAPGAPLHRPDLVLWPLAHGRRPVAVEVELTLKAPRRLEQICRAWARALEVDGVVYFAPAPVRRALERAIARAGAAGVVVLPLESLAPLCAIDRATTIARPVSSRPYGARRGSTIEQTE